MPVQLGQRSLARLVGVDPRLVRVVHRAAAMATAPADDFTVLEGVRTREQMMINYGKGRTASELKPHGIPAKYAAPKAAKVTWLRDPFNSSHRKQADGFGRAVDLAPWPIDWNNHARFQRLAELMLAAAKVEGVRVRWGRDWDMDGRYGEKGETDGPHFELVE